MAETQRGTVINLNAYGGTVRLDDGRLASIPAGELELHKAAYERAFHGRKTVEFQVRSEGRRHPAIELVPQIRDETLEAQIAGYLKMTEEWENPEQAPAHERHFLRKKKRAALFESRHSAER